MFECRWGVVCWGSAAEDLARGTVGQPGGDEEVGINEGTQWQIYTINKIWGGPIYIETSADKKPCRESCRKSCE